MLSELALIFQQVMGSPPHLCTRQRHAKRIPPPDRICLGTAEPGEIEQAGFKSSHVDMLPERISPGLTKHDFRASDALLARLVSLSL